MNNYLLDEIDRIESNLAASGENTITFEQYYDKVFDWRIPDFWRPVVRKLPYTRKSLILLPPGHRKTTTLVAYMAWCLATKHRLRIMVVSHNASLASDIMKQVCNILESPASINLVGQIIPDNPKYTTEAWKSDKRIIYPNPLHKDPNLLAYGIDGGILGYRVDLIVMDDCITASNTVSYTMRKRITDKFWAEIHKRLDPGGQIIVAGSRFYKEDLYDDLEKNDEWQVMKLVATPEKPLWPERFGADMLARERDNDPLFFQAQYMQIPIDAHESLNLDWLSFYSLAPENLTYYIGVDPCDKAATGTDSFAAVVIGKDSTGVSYLIDIETGQYDLDQQCEIVIRLAREYKPAIINVEDKGGLAPLLSRHEFYVRSSQSNLPKALRIRQMAEKFKQRKILLEATADETGYRPTYRSAQFIKEWESFGGNGGHDDILDATEKAYEAALLGGQAATAYNVISYNDTLHRNSSNMSEDEKQDTINSFSNLFGDQWYHQAGLFRR